MTSQEMKKTLWEAADKLRAQMDAAEYKHLALGLIPPRYVSDSFDEWRREVGAMRAFPSSELRLCGRRDETGNGAGGSELVRHFECLLPQTIVHDNGVSNGTA